MAGTSTPDAAMIVRQLAEKHQVAYQPTATDVLGQHITRLSGDDIELDDAERLLLALERAGHVTPIEATRLHADYLRQAKARV